MNTFVLLPFNLTVNIFSHTLFLSSFLSFFLWLALSEGSMGAERAPCLCWTPTMVSPTRSPVLPLHVTAWYVQLTSNPAWTRQAVFCVSHDVRASGEKLCADVVTLR